MGLPNMGGGTHFNVNKLTLHAIYHGQQKQKTNKLKKKSNNSLL